MADEVEDVHHIFPNGLAAEGFSDGYRLYQHRGTAVRLLDGLAELIGFDFGHSGHISWAEGGGYATGG